mmetsp:Transcript_47893/g.137929  ORF Transcript_47893/g.137929 Transcript_47893/m.137929 type:complete len:287 (-) Transcript_47893:170-1030(-)
MSISGMPEDCFMLSTFSACGWSLASISAIHFSLMPGELTKSTLARKAWQIARSMPPMEKPESATRTVGFTARNTRSINLRTLWPSASRSKSEAMFTWSISLMPIFFKFSCMESKIGVSSHSWAPCNFTPFGRSGGVSERYAKCTSYFGCSTNHAAILLKCTMCPAQGKEKNNNLFFFSGTPSGFNQFGADSGVVDCGAGACPPFGGRMTPSNGVRRSNSSGLGSSTNKIWNNLRANILFPSTTNCAASKRPRQALCIAASAATVTVQLGDAAAPSRTRTRCPLVST